MRFKDLCPYTCLFCQNTLARKTMRYVKTFKRDHRTLFYCTNCSAPEQFILPIFDRKPFAPFSLVFDHKKQILDLAYLIIDNYKILNFKTKCFIYNINPNKTNIPIVTKHLPLDLTNLTAIQQKIKVLTTFS